MRRLGRVRGGGVGGVRGGGGGVEVVKGWKEGEVRLLTTTIQRHTACSCPFMFLKSDLLDPLLCHHITGREEDLRAHPVSHQILAIIMYNSSPNALPCQLCLMFCR